VQIKEILTRIFLHPSKLEKTIKFYENIFKKTCSLRFIYKEMNIELAQISSILLLAGEEKDLEKFKSTKTTFLVDSLDDFHNYFLDNGIPILEKPKKVPTGKNMRIQHPDGSIVEYVEHKKDS